MSSLMSNDDDNYMNNRIPRKKTASSLINSGAQSTTGMQPSTTISTANEPAVADILSLRIPRKTKDGAPSNNKKRTHDMSSIAKTRVKKVKTTTATTQANTTTTSLLIDNVPVNDNNIPTYQIVKEGRVSGYPIIVSQVGSEHDAILLGCKATDNPQEYLDNNKDGKVKIRWKFAGYNGLVPTHTVRLKLVDGAPPVRKAAVLSGLLETGDLVANEDDDIDLGDDEDDDAPILKAIRSELLDSRVRSDKDGDYNDQEDRDEKLVCYERSASVGYQGGKSGLVVASADGSGSSISSTNQVEVGSDEVNASIDQDSDNVEGAHTEFDPQVDEADTNSHKAAPSIVTSQSGIKLEDGDADSVATDPMINEEVVPMEVKSEINVKTEGEETDDDELTPPVIEADTNSHKPTPPAVTSQSGIKAEEDDTDSVATDSVINVDALSLLAAYGDDTDDDELKPSVVTSDLHVKLEGEDTDDELNIPPHTSSNDVKIEVEAAYECDTDNDEPKSLVVKSDMNVKAEEVDTDDEMDAQQVDPVASSNDVKNETEAAYGYDTDNEEPEPLEVKSDMNVKTEEEDTDDEMNTSSLSSHDNLIPTVSASTSESEEDTAVVLEFFEKLCSCLSSSISHLEEMIKANPHLLKAKCPHKIPGVIQEGYTAMEAVCQQGIGAATRDLLYELVRLGGKATDKCYEELDRKYNVPFDHLNVLLLSGYYPTKGDYLFLDQLANVFIEELENDDGEVDPIEMLGILYKVVKLGDWLSCGVIDSNVIINNINQLPPLEGGVTHSKGGTINPMEDLLKQYPVDKVRIEHEEMQRKARAVFKMHDEEEKEKSEEMERKNKGEMERNPGHNEKPIKSGLKWTPPDHSTSRVSNTQQPLEKGGKHEEVNGNEGTSGIKWTPPNRSTGNVHEEVYLNLKSTASIPPQEHDMVIVTRGGDVGVEGELVCVDGTDAILKEPNQNFKIVDFTHLATTRRVKVQKDCPGGRKCSVCEMKKDRTDFSKTQWKKGDDAKCKDCIALKQNPEAQKKLAEERNKLLATVYNIIGARRCSTCGIIKKKDEFKCKTDQWSRQGPCEDCIAKQVESQRIAMEEEKKIKKIRRQSTIEESKKSERLLYNQKKERYEQYKKEMEESGRSIEKEMISSTDLLYLVTSVRRCDEFSPCLHGIYTTCKGAQKSAREAFAKESSSYRDGKFLPNDERIAKCDTSEFLVPGIAFNSRVMFELFGEEDDVDYTAIAVTAIKVDVDVNVNIPCLGPAYEGVLDVGERKDIKQPLKLGKVYAIFTHSEGEVSLSGVYTNRDDAIASGLRYANFNDKEVEREQIEDASGVSNGRLFHDEEYNCWQVAMETVTLNDNVNYNRELVLGMHGYCWICPDVEGY